MHGLCIDVAWKDVSRIKMQDEEPGLFEAMKQCIGCDVLALGAVLPNSDVLYVNQLAVLESELYFEHSLATAPLPDSAIVLGSVDFSGEPRSARSGLEATRASVRFMDKWEALEWVIAAKAPSFRERAA